MEKTEKPKSSWRERSKDIKHKWLTPFIYIEWLCEQLSYLLGQWAFINILGHIGRLTILLAIIYYFMGAEGRRKLRNYQAWQVINAAQGKPGSGGRIDALQVLNRDGVSLAGVDVSHAYLSGIDLEKAVLYDANLSRAILIGANLLGADLERANLSKANLCGAKLTAFMNDANLSGAILIDAYLSGTILTSANLTGANLSDADLSGSLLHSANLSGVNLSDADLSGSYLPVADLSGANLSRADLSYSELYSANLLNIRAWKDIKRIEFANIYDVNNPPDGFIEWAKEKGAVEIDDPSEWQALLNKERSRKNPQIPQ